MICPDCKAAPGGICAPHKLATSFDAPTEEEAEIAMLRAQNRELVSALAERTGELNRATSQNSVLQHELAEQVSLVRAYKQSYLRERRLFFVTLPSGMVAG